MQRLLQEDLKERPAAILSEEMSLFEAHYGGKLISDSTVVRLLKRMGFSRKEGLWGRWSQTSG